MARPPLTLAALATAAVPGLEVRAARPHTRGAGGGFDAVRLDTADHGALIVRAPRSETAEAEQSADAVALRAFTPGIRSRLPFDVPSALGQAPLAQTRVLVYDFLPGAGRTADELTETEALAVSVGRAIAAVHALPPSFVADAGLPRATAEETRARASALLRRAQSTGKLPVALANRWERAVDDDALWRFKPTVVNGALTADSFLVEGDHVSAVIGWHALQVGDPAVDLHWMLTSRGSFAEAALSAYTLADEGADALMAQRALLWGELELARWLLHGVDRRDAEIVADAVDLLDSLVDEVHADRSEPLRADTGPVLGVDAVEDLLDRTPRTAAPAHEDRTAPRDGLLLTDSYDFSDVDFDDPDTYRAEDSRPIPLDLDGWGEEPENEDGPDAAAAAAPPAGTGADATAPDAPSPSSSAAPARTTDGDARSGGDERDASRERADQASGDADGETAGHAADDAAAGTPTAARGATPPTQTGLTERSDPSAG
ncbi:phosphotransferase [Agromyces seonyuensis]|uniref:phosphotransferase n=1 Tax=Agromyces seonyuensis TaxID=2662446 RepID=UPI001922005A|nr:phosphotransferase [Agromyces seonyuensis]